VPAHQGIDFGDRPPCAIGSRVCVSGRAGRARIAELDRFRSPSAAAPRVADLRPRDLNRTDTGLDCSRRVAMPHHTGASVGKPQVLDRGKKCLDFCIDRLRQKLSRTSTQHIGTTIATGNVPVIIRAIQNQKSMSIHRGGAWNGWFHYKRWKPYLAVPGEG
jgi:hypothetical protein